MAVRRKYSKNRVVWKGSTRRKLAYRTALDLVANNRAGDNFSLRNMMKAFRHIQAAVLREEGEEYRYIGGPGMAPWLQPMVMEELELLRQPPPDTIPLLTVAASNGDDNTDVIVDLLGEIDAKLNKLLDATHQFDNIINKIDILRGEVKSYEDILIKRRQRFKAKIQQLELTPPPTTEYIVNAKPLRIIVVGIERGSQRTDIFNATRGLSHLVKVEFINTIRTPSLLPHFDQLIVLERLARTGWQKRADELYIGRIHHARGLKGVIDLISRFGGDVEKYRAK